MHQVLSIFLTRTKLNVGFIIGITLMFALQTFLFTKVNLFLSPLLWLFGAGLSSFCLFFLLFYRQDALAISEFDNHRKWIFLGLLSISAIGMTYMFYGIFQQFPIDAKQSDVIPSLEVYVQRFLAGEKVYVAIPFDNYEVWPTYFPGMWMPYIIPELIGIDYRWMPLFSFFICYGYICFSLIQSHTRYLTVITLALIPAVLLYAFKMYDLSVFAFATELMPTCFYMLLIWGLYKKNIVLIAISLALCTLSRYAYTLWIIPFLVIFIMNNNWKTFFKLAIIGFSVVFLLYILPFFLMDPSILTDGLAYYGKTAEDQWKLQFWQQDGEIPFHLGRGLSFSYWFYQLVEGESGDKLAFAQSFHKWICFLVAFAQIGIFFLIKSKVKWNEYLLVSLFIFLSVFYAFLYVPFSYLYMLPLIVGILSGVILFSKGKLPLKD